MLVLGYNRLFISGSDGKTYEGNMYIVAAGAKVPKIPFPPFGFSGEMSIVGGTL